MCYLNDILVTGRSESEHVDNLKNVFHHLRKHGVQVKCDKCTFMNPSVQYLGHRIDAQRLQATDDKIAAIMGAPVQELRSFAIFATTPLLMAYTSVSANPYQFLLATFKKICF